MNVSLQNDYLQLIDSAIRSQRVVQIKLNGSWRTVEPYVAGIHQTTNSVSLYCYCRDVIPGQAPGESRWQVFSLDEIDEIELTWYEFETHCDYEHETGLFAPIYFRMVA